MHRVEFTCLLTDTATVADIGVNPHFLFFAGGGQAKRHTGHLEAGPTSGTLVLVDIHGGFANFVAQNAGVFVDQNVWARCFEPFFDRCFGFLEVVGVEFHNIVDTQCLDQRNHFDLAGRDALQGLPGTRVLLAAGHASGAVVHNDDQGITSVVGHAHQSGHPRVEKG